jgi:glycoside/pentoside/hexuronide:cation symporter, GPH family
VTAAAGTLDHAGARLPAWSLFAGTLAAAGLPIYIHAPKFYADTYGVSLATLGLVLFGLRLLDVVQDPALGWLSERLRARRAAAVAVAVVAMALAMLGLFAIVPPVSPVLWFALMLSVLFSAFSFLTITYYAEGVAKAARLGSDGHLRLAGWRESGALLGVCVAAAAPSALAAGPAAPFAIFAAGFACLCLVATAAMRSEWTGGTQEAGSFRAILADRGARWLIALALVNAAPVAVSSTLFLFYVESRLAAPGLEGPLLILFFLAAAASVPGWSRAARVAGPKPVLLGAMTMSILAFATAAFLGPGDALPFALVCLASGAALGADMTLLPALFARNLARREGGGALGFGIWSFASKFTLAFAAVALLPLLDATGFRPGAENPAAALATLGLLYALVPCALKLVAIGLLLAMPGLEDRAWR